MDSAGQIRWLGEAVRPDIAVITNVDDVHLAYFESREAICRAKAEIFENLRPGGLAVINGDDELLTALELGCEKVLCGLSAGCGVRVEALEDLGLEGVRCTIVTAKERYALEIPSPGVHMASLAALAVAVAERLGLTKDEITRGVAAYRPADNRLRVERLPGGRLMINDSYNANPRSVRADVAILAQHRGGKRIALLGDMTELGAAEEPGHRSVGRLVGEWMVPEAKAAGCPDVRWFEHRDAAREDVLSAFGPGDALLLKASHFLNRFDLMADYLREYPFAEG